MIETKQGNLGLQKARRLPVRRRLIYEEMTIRRSPTPMAVIEGNRFTVCRGGKVVSWRIPWTLPNENRLIGVCTSLPTTPHLVVGRSACRVGVRPSLNRSWAQRSRPVVRAGRRAFPGDESVVD